MHNFTVLLLYPEYLTDGRTETYLAHVEAPDVEEAILLARSQVDDENYEIGDLAGQAPILSDYKVLAVFDGHLVDRKDEGWRNANEPEVENVRS